LKSVTKKKRTKRNKLTPAIKKKKNVFKIKMIKKILRVSTKNATGKTISAKNKINNVRIKFLTAKLKLKCVRNKKQI